MKEIWIERETAAGLKYITRSWVRSRKQKELDLSRVLDFAVKVSCYGWAAVLTVFTAAALLRCL